MSFRISGVGCSLVDELHVPVDFSSAEFQALTAHGLRPGALVFAETLEQKSGRKMGELLEGLVKGRPAAALNLGGPGAVSLIHAAQVLHSQNLEVHFVGAWGRDRWGDFLREAFSRTQVKVDDYHVGRGPTPSTFVLSDPDYDKGRGERCFINTLGAASELEPGHLPSSFFDSGICAFGGTALTPKIHNRLGELLLKAKQRGAFNVVNTVFDFDNEMKGPGHPWPLVEGEAWRAIDVLILDQEEATKISGRPDGNSALEYFTGRGVGGVIVTRGPEPLLLAAPGGRVFDRLQPSSMPVCELVGRELASKVESSGDTTGCGDNFAGGVLASLARQLIEGRKPDLIVAAREGVAAGGFACFYKGGTYFESEAGEKDRQIEKYRRAYRQQMAAYS